MSDHDSTAGIDARFCVDCGSALEPDAAFCSSCGAGVTSADALQTAPAEPTAPKPTAPTGSWRRVLRRLLAATLAMLTLLGVGLYPVWSAPILERFAAERETGIEPSTWLTEIPDAAPSFTRRSLWASVTEVLESPEVYSERLVLVSGTPVAVERRGGMTYALFVEGAHSLLVGQLGGPGVLAEGELVSVAGVLSPEGDELLVLATSSGAPGEVRRTRILGHMTLAAAAALLVAAIFVRLRRARDRKARVVAAAAMLASCLVLLAGCEVKITTTVNADGSGIVQTRVVTGEDRMDELMKLPNAEPFVESWLEAQRTEGLTAERTTNQLKIDRTFGTLEEFGADDGGIGLSWSRLGSVEMPDGRHMYFLASLDTASVYPDAPEEGSDTTAYDKLVEEIEGSTLRYELKLPGTPVASNAEAGSSWELPMGQRGVFFAESRVGSDSSSQNLIAVQRTWGEGIRWLWACVAGLTVWALIAYPWRSVKKGGDRG